MIALINYSQILTQRKFAINSLAFDGVFVILVDHTLGLHLELLQRLIPPPGGQVSMYPLIWNQNKALKCSKITVKEYKIKPVDVTYNP